MYTYPCEEPHHHKDRNLAESNARQTLVGTVVRNLTRLESLCFTI